MTGLYENISKLENSDNLTFLLRTPKIQLSNLSLRQITFSYQNIFNISEEKACNLAIVTKGYAYGYQLLGNLLYKHNVSIADKKVMEEFDLILEDNVYAKIWSLLTENEKKILFAMVENSSVAEILGSTGLSNSALQVYKKELSKQGLLDATHRGSLYFSLPRFKEFVSFQALLARS